MRLNNKPTSLVFEANQNSGDKQYFTGQLRSYGVTIDLRAGYRRCRDLDEEDHPGEDFLLVRSDEDYVAGIIADGVSQSFLGHLAAFYVSQALMDFLWTASSTQLTTAHISQALTNAQEKCAIAERSYIARPTMSDQVRGIVESRRLAGSQTCFVCCFLDLKMKTLTLFQLGDTLALVVVDEIKDDELRDPILVTGDSTARWSSRFGLIGSPTHQSFSHVRTIVLKSDGVDDHFLDLVSNPCTKQAFDCAVDVWARNDDASFFSIHIGHEDKPEVP